MDALNRINIIIPIIRDDPQAVSLIRSVLTAANRYVTAVCTQSIERIADASAVPVEETVNLDKNRTLAHNTLIDSVKICNRYLFKQYGFRIPAGGVYSSDPTHIMDDRYRSFLGDWGGQLIDQLFHSRVR